MHPPYSADELTPAFHLRYDWTAWPSESMVFPTWLDRVLEDLAPTWENDGIRLLEYRCQSDQVQVLASVLPTVSPSFFAQRMKGRLDHALRQSGTAISFSRKVSVSTVGRNCREQVEQYVQQQSNHHRFADPYWQARLSDLVFVDPTVYLSQPTEVKRGRYWFNLHLGAWGSCFADLRTGFGVAILAPTFAARPDLVARHLINTLLTNFLTRNGFAMLHATGLVRNGTPLNGDRSLRLRKASAQGATHPTRVLLLMAPHNSGKSTTALRLTLSRAFRARFGQSPGSLRR